MRLERTDAEEDIEGYFNPRTPGRVRPQLGKVPKNSSKISIHAPRVGCDPNFLNGFFFSVISIHAPRVGCDGGHQDDRADPYDFNPRTPGRVRRSRSWGWRISGTHFNPRTPGRVRHKIKLFCIIVFTDFNPRTPGRVRRRLRVVPGLRPGFQSTHPG